MSKWLRDPVSGLTHCIGAVLAVVALIVLILQASDPLKMWHLVSFSIFGAGLILLYTSSTLYHWLPLSESGIRRLRRLDHMMIFVLIAATYTPVCLIPLRGGVGWSLFGISWSLAVAGVLMKLFWLTAPRWLSTGLYLGMGWLIVAAIWPLIQIMPQGGMFWMVAGGLFYSIGAVIYGLKWPNPWPRIMGFHEIFHVFVILGSVAHFWMMYKYIMVIG